MGYAKLFSSITESSLWSEPKEVRILFVTMLAKADACGFIEASTPGLARVANLTLDETELALEVLQSSDPHSKNKTLDGRRIAKVEGGWCLINYEDYRNRRDDNRKREYMREYMREYRKGSVKQCKTTELTVNPAVSENVLCKTQAEATAEADSTQTPKPLSQDLAPLVLVEPQKPPVGLDPYQARLNALFRRRNTTPWNGKELKAYRSIVMAEEDMKLIESYYTATIHKSEDHRRHDLCTLLNNWNGEVDRARRFKPEDIKCW